MQPPRIRCGDGDGVMSFEDDYGLSFLHMCRGRARGTSSGVGSAVGRLPMGREEMRWP